MSSLVMVALQAGGIPIAEDCPLIAPDFSSKPSFNPTLVFSHTPILTALEDERKPAAESGDDCAIVDKMAIHDGANTHLYPRTSPTIWVSLMRRIFSARALSEPC